MLGLRYAMLTGMKRILMIVLPVGIGLVLFLVYAYTVPSITETTQCQNGLEIAAWLGVQWVSEQSSPTEIEELAEQLQTQGVDYAYIYTSYLRFDGQFNANYEYARTFVDQLRQYVPEITLLAWIGVPIQSPNTDNRLQSPEVRQQIVDFGVQTIDVMGFDGVHLNAELVANDDRAFLDLLYELAFGIGERAMVSTTAHALAVTDAVTIVPIPRQAHHWEPSYLQTVARLVDQVVMMVYDSGLVFPRDYYHWTQYQIETSLAVLNESDSEFLVGLPTSEEWTASHQLMAEKIEIALHAFDMADPNTIDGVAIYPYWETDSHEWQQIQHSVCSE